MNLFGQKTEKAKRIPTDTFETIPYRGVYQNGIIEDYDGRYSKSYKIPEINYNTEEEEKQENIVLDYEKVVNTADEKMIGQLTVINRNIDPNVIRNSILMKPQQDELNGYRDEFNAFFLDILSSGHNNMIKEKYWTISVEAENIVEATDSLKRVDRRVTKALRKICKQDITPMTIKDRLSLMYDIYNSKEQLPFDKKAANFIETKMKDNKEVTDINLKKVAEAGLFSKHLVSPDSFDFSNKRYFVVGDEVYGRTMFLDNIPSTLSTGILDDLTNIACNLIASVTYEQVSQAEATQMVRRRLQAANSQINKQQMDAAKEGITNAGAVATELENARDAAKELIQDVATRDQHIFMSTIFITFFASSVEELDKHSRALKSIAAGHQCQMRYMNGMQELAFNMSLPLAKKTLKIERPLTTESASAFLPFTAMDLNQPNGICYGINPETQNMIHYDRKSG